MSLFLSAPTLPINTKAAMISNEAIFKRSLITSFSSITGSKRKNEKMRSFICLSVDGQSKVEKKVVVNGKNLRRKVVLSEGRDVDECSGVICPGCGVYMQDIDPNLPGFYKKKKVDVCESDDFDDGSDGFKGEIEDCFEVNGFEEAKDVEIGEYEGDFDKFDEESGGSEGEIEGGFELDCFEEAKDVESDENEGDFVLYGLENEGELENDGGIDWDSEEFDEELDNDEGSDAKELAGFAPVGVGYGNVTEEVLNEKRSKKKKKLSKSERKRLARERAKESEEVTVCARCYSLRNYGQVKNQSAENLIPDFDFDRLISTRLMKPAIADSTVVVMVVDCVDFDGSFPKRAARSLFKALEGKIDTKISKKLPKLVLVATKVDLLPSQISPTRLDRWVRQRARAAGAPKLNAVYLVSSKKDLGVRNLLSYIKELAGPRGHVWVIGAQNAGKSTLINTFAKKQGAKVTKLTEAAVPGTTLGILRVGGILSGKAKMYDTPGLLHPYLVSMRLTREEQKMVEIRKELQPRTYRIKVGQAIHVGGLMRLDLVQASVQTIYVTVWASPSVSLHLGKLETADETWRKHVGIRLQPPIGTDKVSSMGEWKEGEYELVGTSWDVNAWDISVAGFCWVSVGLKGKATLKVWTYDGVEVVLREPLALDRAKFLERPGFWLPQAISEAIGNQNKVEARKKQQLDEEFELHDATV